MQSASRTAVDYANTFYAPSYTIFGANVGFEKPKTGAALQRFAGTPAPTFGAELKKCAITCGSGRAREGSQSGPKLLN
ncbi:hypothetical protein I5S53_20845 [Pseudomonas juntendi]|uniref:hypothetical protein n=1 Tax=Pseudomonas TaxID=286 RepID=UPI0015AFEF1D|nr:MULTISPECIES: hypothetical protein [Pseudomonas]MBH3386399.1 hypothetical protein [Pseudomonas juntendi]